MKHVLFIQGGGKGAFAADKPLADSLQGSLGSEYEVHYPAMPAEDDPSDELWRRRIGQEVNKIGRGVMLVGHSVGAYVVLRFVLSGRSGMTFPGIFLVAAPFVGPGGWELDQMCLPDEFAGKLPGDSAIFLYHARDDEIVPFAHLDLYRQKLPAARTRALENGGHQIGGDMSIVAADIRGI